MVDESYRSVVKGAEEWEIIYTCTNEHTYRHEDREQADVDVTLAPDEYVLLSSTIFSTEVGAKGRGWTVAVAGICSSDFL